MSAQHWLGPSTGAQFSDCKRYRWLLWRVWDHKLPMFGFIGLNPSTADETNDDPTVARCGVRARKMGAGGLVVGNLYGYRATDPRKMKEQADPVGEFNDVHLRMLGQSCKTVLLGWGAHATRGRSALIIGMLRALPKPPKLIHLGLTGSGEPRHPLYVGYKTPYIEVAP